MKHFYVRLFNAYSAPAKIPNCSVRLLSFLLLFLCSFLVMPQIVKANWWNATNGEPYAVKDRFKVSFDNASGRFTIRAFAIDKGYFSHSTLATTYAELSYTTDGYNYVPFYSFFYTPHWQDTQDNSGFIAASSFDSHATNGGESGGDRIIYLSVFNGIRNIKGIKIVCDLTNSDGDDKQAGNSAVFNYEIPKANFQINGYNYLEDGRVKIDWSSQWNPTNQYLLSNSSTSQFGASGNKIADFGQGLSGGTFYVNQSNQSQKFYLVHYTYSGKITDTATIMIPALTHPSAIAAVYNQATQKVDLTWTIPTATGDSVQMFPFKLQRATKADFSDAVDIEISGYQSTKYAPDLTSYTYSVQPYANAYYRIARNVNQDWGWSLGKSVQSSLTHAAFTTASNVALSLDNARLLATLTWTASGIWTEGTQFTITRFNKTTGISTPIQLEMEDYYSGKFADSLIKPCNEYYYTLQIKPAGNLGFVAEKAVQSINTVTPYTIGTIRAMTSSKGYFPDRVDIQWHSEGVFDNFIVKRKVYGSADNYAQITSIPGANVDEFQTDDAKGFPGVYYQYMVYGTVICNGETRYSQDTLYTIGFRAPTGNIYGRVTFGNGQAVENVDIRLESADNTQLGSSVYLNGSPDSYLKTDSLMKQFEDTAFTISTWIKPDDVNPENQIIFSRDGQYELGFDAAGALYFQYGNDRVTGDYDNENGSFIHVAGVNNHGELLLLVNDSVINQTTIAYTPANISKNTPAFIGSKNGSNNFKGYIDEMNVWNIAQSAEWISQNYTRLLTGGENGLTAYWRFDETITDQFYDISHANEFYNRNDGTMSSVSVEHSDVIPGIGQLALKGTTDSTGNYMISGIPYTGNGTTYTIAPLFGTHQFDPISVNRMVSPSSNSFTVDFKDNSSFLVSGTVYYRNTTVPVGGVQFKIDGQLAVANNGGLVQSGTDGRFTISVPVGYHDVQLLKNNHVFENDGRITMRDGTNRNYQGPVSELILYDSTTIRLIGRVAGGTIQQGYPLGHSLSTNNLGEELSLKLHFSNPAYELASKDSSVIVDHLLPSNQTDSSKIHKTRVVYSPDKIVIYPDSLTGEFAADIIPEKFTLDEVNATGWGNMLEDQGSGSQLLDFSNKFLVQSEEYNYTDSTESNQGTWTYKDYSDEVLYNDSYVFIKRVTPSFSILQTNNQGKPLDFFGDSLYLFQNIQGDKDSVSLIDRTKSGNDKYLFSGHPVFSQGNTYNFSLKAFERYPFYKINGSTGSVDTVATRDGSVSITNGIKGIVVPDTLTLDTLGSATYQFVAGDPDKINGTKNFSSNIKFGSALNVAWMFGSQNTMSAIVLGSQKVGTDFVTAGPNKMLMVLRDPPGSRSFTFAEKGSTITRSSTTSFSADNTTSITGTAHLGPEIVTWYGFGAGIIENNTVVNDIGAGATIKSEVTDDNTEVTTTTLSNRFQTSDDPAFVGAPADLFVGYSTNITYGQSNNIVIIRSDEKESTDEVIPGLESGEYIIVERDGISLGEKFGTLFAYPQQHIETVLIPNLLHLRDYFLHSPAFTNGQALADEKDSVVYVSKLALDDPNFGRSNNDPVFGEAAKNTPFDDGPSYTIYFPTGTDYRTDTIMTINQYVAQWQEELKNNEKAKINSNLLQNYSFHAGNPIDYTEENSAAQTQTTTFNFITGGSIFSKDGFTVMGIGMEMEIKDDINAGVGGSEENTTENVITNGFQLAADGVGEYISVDVNKADDGSFAFRTKGGQTECPYEGGSVTKYYQPGLMLDQPTVQMDKPQISVENAVINGVPSVRPATFTLSLDNASDAQWSTDYVLTYGSSENIQGALLAVDGASIAGGRNYPINYGDKLVKVLTLTKGPDALDYENIPIILHSACQYDPTGYQQIIADTAYISAHFIPSCTDVHIKSPSDKWILNTESPENDEEKRYLPLVIDQFDVNDKLFDHVELQYKSSSESDWKTVAKFFSDQGKYDDDQSGEKELITDPAGINYKLVMDDVAFADHSYDIQAVSYCLLSPGNIVTTESNTITGIKDTYTPRLFGSPQPANGILGIGEDIRLNFNETINAGRLTAADFQVTGIRNGSLGDHTVSIDLDGQSDFLETEFDRNLGGRDITVEMWVLPDSQKDQTLFSQGDANESMELALTQDGHVAVTVGKNTVQSDRTVNYRNGQWEHVAMNYHAQTGTVTAFFNFDEVMSNVPVGSYNGVGHFEFGRSISKQGNFFGGKMHEARIWTKSFTGQQLQINSLKRFSGTEEGMLDYYPINEGKGDVAVDKARGANAQIIGNWSTPDGKAFLFNGDGYIRMNTSNSPVISAMDYTLELWFKAEGNQQNATLVSNGKGDGSETAKGMFSLGFENGLLTYRNDGAIIQSDGNYMDNNWHHLAISVNRNSGLAQMFVDGNLKKFSDAKDVGGLQSAYTYLGARAWNDPADPATVHYDQYFKGRIDEFRIWNTYLNQTLINKNNNVRLKGDEIGLLAYYPFEKYYEFQNNQEMDATLSDMKIQEQPNLVIPDAVAVNADVTDDKAPIIDRGPVENLKFDYVVNNDALIINMREEPKSAIEKTIITFKVEKVRDENNNMLVSPITWTAYIDQNQLKWSDDELNLSKDLYSPMEFEADIINRGGGIQNFRLDNLPSWLTATPSSGTVNPTESRKVTFTVNEGLNVGSYNEVINMLNDNDEVEGLNLNLTVLGKTPKWSVNPADFKYNMSIYGKIRINGIFSSDKGDILAAFDNGKCVGVAHNEYFATGDLWYTFMTVYGNSLTSDNLEFRIWDASEGKMYEALPAQSISFANDGIAGTSGQPVIFDASNILYGDIDLNVGWNWISFNLANPNMDNVSASLKNGLWRSGDIIKNNDMGFDQFSGTQNWVGTLSHLNNTSLFMLRAGNAQTLSMKGTKIDLKATPISIKGARWNYISYLPLVSLTVKDALADYDASDEDVIKSQTGFSMYDSKNGWVGNLTILKPGEGYMLYRKAANDVSFVYPEIIGNLIPRREGAINGRQIAVDSYSFYEGNMTMVATVEEGFDLKPDDKILAFAGNELRGKSLAIDNPLTRKSAFFLNIAGDGQEPIVFKVERNGRIIAQSNTILDYRLNGEPGTLRKPVVLLFNNPDADADANKKISVSPNPFREKVNIKVSLANAQSMDLHEVQISVTDVMGRIIFRQEKETVVNGHYETSWNGRNAENRECAKGVYFIQISVDGVPSVYKVIKQ